MRRSSKLFVFLFAVAFLAALAWALSAQSDLWQKHARPVRPRAMPEGEIEKPPENPTGVVGNVDEGTTKALEKNLKAERDARKRLDTPSGNRR
ncbi:MAG: hypothetical protein HYZ13_13210 [Acidobacteria bacterium]|nr:hypothetical protein [Acidobacteriota bacterium]